ncbi:MAG: hypothetical protein ABIY70_03235 [Capsulimonas sp.]|uniref:hypothetical protein n=1 Tax=Capsulimonas sp. TaxID=2494211 RepID=UPI003264FD17
MRIVASIIFRYSREITISFLPKSLYFLVPDIVSDDPGIVFGDYVERAICNVETTSLVAEELIEWGSSIYQSKSIIKSIVIDEKYDFDDIEDNSFVEILMPGLIESPVIKNFNKTIELRWACDHCERIADKQISDLNLKISSKSKLQQTYHWEWIAHKSLYDTLESFGVALRPLKKNDDYSQIIVPRAFRFRVDIDPVVVLNNICPGCQNHSLYRSREVVGDVGDDEYPTISINRERPISISRNEAVGVSWARSPQAFYTFSVSDRPWHKSGNKVPSHDIFPIYYLRSRVDVISIELARALWEAGAHDIKFRRTHIVPDNLVIDGLS